VSAPVTIDALRTALGAATASNGGATPRLTQVIESIGWRGGDAAEASEVAQEIAPALAACVREGGDLGAMYRQVAEVLRHSGPVLDGSLPPVTDYLPAAAEVVRRFVAGATTG